MTWTPLSGDLWAKTSDAVKAARARRWQVIVARLQADHHARYHDSFAARLATRVDLDDRPTIRARVAALENAREASDLRRWAA